MTNELNTVEARLHFFMAVAARSGEEACIREDEIPVARKIMEDTGMRVKLAVFDGEHIASIPRPER